MMQEGSIVERLTKALGLPVFLQNGNELVVEVNKQNLQSVAQSLIKELSASLVLMTAGDYRFVKGQFQIVCVFSIPGDAFVLVQMPVNPDDASFPALSPVLPAAQWYEREIKDMFGLIPHGHPDLRPLIKHRAWDAYPLRKDFDPSLKPPTGDEEFSFREIKGEGVFEIPVGPIHAGIIEPGHFRFSSVGETILNLEANLFYTHKGTEKLCEEKTYDQALLVAERICGVCSFSHSTAFCQAVEKLAPVRIPKRAGYIRTLAMELERLYNHVGDVGNICAGTGFAFGASQGGRLKEKLLNLNEQLFGSRYLRGINCIGGVKKDLGEIGLLEQTISDLEKEFKEVTSILLENDTLLDRLANTGVLKAEDVMELGVVGPAARASGVKKDTRIDHPHLLYGELSFEVPVGQAGDVLTRTTVRIEEVWQSIRLIRQLLEQLPQGELFTKIEEIEPYRAALGYVESARGQVIHYLVSGPENKIFRHMIRSASYTNWPAVPLAVQGNIVPDFPLINKSFELCYSCSDR